MTEESTGPGPVSSPVPIRLRVDDRPATLAPGTPASGNRPGSRMVGVASSARPRLSWVVPLVRPGQRQSGYEVRIVDATTDPEDPHDVSGGSPVVWSSGRVRSEVCTHVRPEADLVVHGRYWWTVRTWDEQDTVSDWAGPVDLELGPLTAGDWAAVWLSAPSGSTLVGRVEVGGTIRSARLHLTAQGVHRASINRTVVNPGSAEPSRTDAVRAVTRTYDVTDLVASDTEIRVVLGASHWVDSGHAPRLLAELVVETDGGLVRYGTGADWTVEPSVVTHDEAFYLERHDLRRIERDGSAPEVRAEVRAEARAQVLASAGEAATSGVPHLPTWLEPDPAPELHVVDQWVARELSRPVPGTRVFDAGLNVAGRAQLELGSAVAAGRTVTLVHGELLDERGQVDTGNLSMPYDRDRERQCFELITSGEPGDVDEPWFAFYGFRYVEVRGLPEDVDATVTVRVLHSDLADVATFSCDDPTIEALVAAARRTQLNNFHGIPEDCPTREQSGWTGDAAATADLALAQLDVAGFYRKWLGDLVTSQGTDGSMPGIAPSLKPGQMPSDPVWGSALQKVLEGLWLHDGEPDLVREHLPALRRWADYQLGLLHDGVVSGAPISYGHDWLALEQTPPELLHTGATLDCLDALARLEEAVGDPSESDRRRAQADGLRASARAAFHDDELGHWANGTQAAYAVALVAGLVRPEERPAVSAALATDVRRRGNRVSSGFGATATLLEALGSSDLDQLVHDVIHQPETPGVGAMLATDLGTLWESWWIDPDNHGTGSLDHVGLGGPFATWVWRRLVGLTPTAPGYRVFRVAPHPVEGVNEVRSTVATPQGDVEVSWTCGDDRLDLAVTVPVGSTAEVWLPADTEGRTFGSGRHEVSGPCPERSATAPVAQPPWRPPALLSESADVGGGAEWLALAIPDGRVAVSSMIIELEIVEDQLVCMPVHHAELTGPLVLARGVAGAAADTDHLVRLSLDRVTDPTDLTDATFVYAQLDLCQPNPPGRPELVLRVHAADGSVLQRRQRSWPAGWNRITVDVDEWPGRSTVTGVEVGVVFAGPQDGAAATPPPVAFSVGRIGWSARRRTW